MSIIDELITDGMHVLCVCACVCVCGGGSEVVRWKVEVTRRTGGRSLLRGGLSVQKPKQRKQTSPTDMHKKHVFPVLALFPSFVFECHIEVSFGGKSPTIGMDGAIEDVPPSTTNDDQP